jgi:hypothetical protein
MVKGEKISIAVQKAIVRRNLEEIADKSRVDILDELATMTALSIGPRRTTLPSYLPMPHMGRGTLRRPGEWLDPARHS